MLKLKNNNKISNLIGITYIIPFILYPHLKSFYTGEYKWRTSVSTGISVQIFSLFIILLMLIWLIWSNRQILKLFLNKKYNWIYHLLLFPNYIIIGVGSHFYVKESIAENSWYLLRLLIILIMVAFFQKIYYLIYFKILQKLLFNKKS
jgi:hypothetical protein